MGSLLHLKDKDLGELAPKLAPFIRCYAPFQELPTRAELKSEGYQKVEEMSFLEECEQVYFQIHGFYPNEHPDLQQEVE